MAVNSEPTSSELIIRVEDGTTSSGAIRYKNLSFRNIKAGATDNDVKAVADLLGNAQIKPVAGILRSTVVTLTGEPE
ncbi:MAG: DUF1659 domain-containing protein [Syntrophomonadaceae bacterium]|nr:DUF1659 domain-containing protein [Syntrophomonadaceae bacterium]